MSQELLRKAAASSMRTEPLAFKIGDTVRVSVRIVEGDKERVQAFTGTVLGRRGSGISETVTIRRIVNNEGVERIFPVHSPKVAGIEVVRGGKTRRAKLYYLRERRGKATRLKELKAESSRVKKPKKPQTEDEGETDSAEQEA
ncbi:MAG TPA: 50S ribosomal protein L19 [Phycisphaerae bacterium]|nr:50S ribosomal protein L19 [Phycisphaerae bacterium]